MASNQKQPNCPSTSEQLNKWWHIHTTRLSNKKERTTDVHTSLGAPQRIMLSEKADPKRVHIIFSIYNILEMTIQLSKLIKMFIC